jgi:hypothetical protein
LPAWIVKCHPQDAASAAISLAGAVVSADTARGNLARGMRFDASCGLLEFTRVHPIMVLDILGDKRCD